MAEQAKWYVIHTYSGYEQMVKDTLEKLIVNNNLQNQILEIKILMEETVLNSNVDTIKKLAYLAGGVMFYAYRHNVPFELVLPSQWRKAAGLQQGAKVKREVLKLESMQAVKVAYGLEVGDDASDAILIARSAFDLPKINITENDVDWERVIELD